MGYDAGLVERVRDALEDVARVTEKAMFGGLVFLVDGNMCVGVRGDSLLVRVGPERHAEAVATPHARPLGDGRRVMTGFVWVAEEGTRRDEDFSRWVRAAIVYAETLRDAPARPSRGRRAPHAGAAPTPRATTTPKTAKAKAAARPEAKTKRGAKTKAEASASSGAKAKAAATPEAKTKRGPKTKPEASAQSGAKTKVSARPEAKTKPEAPTKRRANTKAPAKPDAPATKPSARARTRPTHAGTARVTAAPDPR